MPPFAIQIPHDGHAVAVSAFDTEADRALAAWKDSNEALEETRRAPGEQVAQVEAAIGAAKVLVAGGVVGSEGVYVVLGGNANPKHDVTKNIGRLESMVSIGVYQRPAPVPAQKQKQSPTKGGSTNG